MSAKIKEYFSSLKTALGSRERGTPKIQYIRKYAASHVLNEEYLTKVENNTKKLLLLYLLREDDEGYVKNKTTGPLIFAIIYLAELGMAGSFDRDFVMYSCECSRPFLYKYTNHSLAILDWYTPKKLRRSRWDIQYGSDSVDAKNLVSRLLFA